MKNLRMIWLLGLILVLMLSGCANSPKQASTSKTEANDPKNRKVAVKMDEILKGKAGKYAGDRYDKKKVEQELDKIPKNASDKEVFNSIVDLIGEDFRPEKKSYDEFDTSYSRVGSKPGDNTKMPNMKEKNLAILLDSSGSMSSRVSGGQKMEVAKAAVQQFVSKAPKDTNVSLTAYGHKGSNSKADKKISCSAVEEVYPLKQMDKKQFESALTPLKPTGWTPLASAIKQARESFANKGNAKAENVVFVVSDGLETCGGDPVKEAKKLAKAHIKATVNIIGFDVNNEEQQTLQEVAEAGGGTYFTAQSKEDLKEYFYKQYLELEDKWRQYNEANLGKNMDDENQKSGQLLKLSGSVDKKKINESDRFTEAINYMLNRKEYKKLDMYKFERRDSLNKYFLDRYSKTSDNIHNNSDKSSDKLKEDVKKGFDTVEKNRRDQ
ncbi:Ca-activated chloride channel family protein [Marininema mesophilum]|uniref:Ca-activated chloride channel family protein n=1 Tax=Marininema mesophilum TaxID=1048340 RepID=A0A1H2X5P6_9BACL|nr:VWA domain-containing protein [Marininema mesophilum]SDW88111.1 Ca-activated chloride channel family protein [Marininema mesophilum]